MTAISIITPWRDHPELIPDYERSVAGAQVIIVDNASAPDQAGLLRDLVQRLGGVYVRNEQDRGFAAANNQGLEYARRDIVVFLNDDIIAAPGFLDTVAHDVGDGELVGPSLQKVLVYGLWIPYLEGWCVAGRRVVWAELKGWDADAYPDYYWEDADLCLRVSEAGWRLKQIDWPIQHKCGRTTQSLLRWGDVYERNRATFAARVKPIYERLRRQQGYG